MTPCPYCGGIAKRITCGAVECQKQRRKAYAATDKAKAYRNSPGQKAYRAAYLATDKARTFYSSPERKAYEAAYAATDEQKAKRKAYSAVYYAREEVKARFRARYLRLKEAASDAAKLAVILGAWSAAWIIAAPSQARAAVIAVPEDSTVIPNAGLLFLALVMIGTMILLAIIAAIDRAKYGALDRASLAARRARIERDNDEYAAAHRRGDWE